MLKYIFVRSDFWDIFAYFYVENRKKSRKICVCRKKVVILHAFCRVCLAHGKKGI